MARMNDVLLVSFQPGDAEDESKKPLLVVGRKKKGKDFEVANAYTNEDAIYIYKLLLDSSPDRSVSREKHLL